MKKLVLGILLGLVLVGCSNQQGKVIEINAQQCIEKFENKETFVFFITESECPRCKEHREELDLFLKENPLTIYMVVVDDDVNLDSFPQLQETYLDGIEFVPASFYVVDGKIENQVNGKMTKDAMITWMIRLELELPNE